MTKIKIRSSTLEFKRGFTKAIEMVDRWVNSKSNPSIEDIRGMVKAANLLNELSLKEEEKNENDSQSNIK